MTSGDHHKLRRNRAYRDWRAKMLRQLGDRCHICQHTGARDLDHLVPLSVDPSRLMDPSNVLPAHGVDGCPVCPLRRNGARRCCNQERQAGQSEESRPGRRPDTGAMSIAELEEFYKVGPGGSVTRVRDGLMIRREW